MDSSNPEPEERTMPEAEDASVAAIGEGTADVETAGKRRSRPPRPRVRKTVPPPAEPEPAVALGTPDPEKAPKRTRRKRPITDDVAIADEIVVAHEIVVADEVAAAEETVVAPSTPAPRRERTSSAPRERASVASTRERAAAPAPIDEPSEAPAPPLPAIAAAPRERAPMPPARERAPSPPPRERAPTPPSRDRSPRDRAARPPVEAVVEAPEPTNGRANGSAPRPAIHRRAFPSEHLDDDAIKVLRRLHRNGYKAYLVGGCVRDLLLSRKPKDFDVATSARPHEVKDLFRNCRVIGRRFRLAHILFGGGKVIETATFRRDPSAAEGEDTFIAEVEEIGDVLDSGEMDAVTVTRGSGTLRPSLKARDDDADLLIRTDNVFGEPHEDALRRDFTINGLFYDIERGEVIDYVGGLRDLERRAIHTIGLPDVRFREDPVRILRAIKFSARLDLGIDPDSYDAIVAQREELRKSAAPRLLEEILRLLRSGAAHRSIWLSWETGVLSVVLPDLAVFLDDDAPRSRLLWGRLDAIDASIRAGRVPSDSVLLAAVLLGPVEEAIEGAKDAASAYDDFMQEVTESLAVPRRMQEKMRAIIGSQRRLHAGRIGTLARRDFFAEAVHLFEIECAARGVRAPDFQSEANPDDADVVRRRRRRRTRR